MDPNETLRKLRLTILQREVDEDPGVKNAHAEEIVEYVSALDEWLSKGGFLPDEWVPSQAPTNVLLNLPTLQTRPCPDAQWDGLVQGPPARVCGHPSLSETDLSEHLLIHHLYPEEDARSTAARVWSD